MFASLHPWKKAYEGGSGLIFYRNPDFGRAGDFSVEILEVIRESTSLCYQVSYGMIELTRQGTEKYGAAIQKNEPEGIILLWHAMGIDDIELQSHIQIGENGPSQPGCRIYHWDDNIIDILRDVVPGFDFEAMSRTPVTLLREVEDSTPSPNF